MHPQVTVSISLWSQFRMAHGAFPTSAAAADDVEDVGLTGQRTRNLTGESEDLPVKTKWTFPDLPSGNPTWLAGKWRIYTSR